MENVVESEREGEMMATAMMDLNEGGRVYESYIKHLPQLFDLLSDQKFCERVGYCLEVGIVIITFVT